MKHLAIICTHPIQYYSPIFKLLAERGQIDVKVYFTKEEAEYRFDKGFQQAIEWDIPLLEGFKYEFCSNHSLISSLKASKPDAILVFGWSFKGHFQVMKCFKNQIPIWFRGDSHLLDEKRGIKQLLRRAYLSYVYKHIDVAFYVGSNNKAYYLKHRVPSHKLVFAPHAIDNERFSAYPLAEQRALEWRQSLGINDEEIVFLYVGKFEAKKAPDLLLKAFKRTTNQNIRLLMVGNGELEHDLKDLAREDKRILFLAFQNQSKMPLVYRLGDIYCLPSRGPNETWGLAVNEAMASKRPVLVSDKVGAAVDLVVPGSNGYLFPSENENALLECLLEFAHLSKEERLKMSAHAESHIQNWNFSAIAKAIEETI